ncbi:hypothetical protein Tco_0359443 [Tanacetum coccineum]
MVPVLTTTKIEQHQVFETQDLSHVEFISAKEFNEKQVVAEVDDTVLIELDPWSNKENPKEIVDDDDDMIMQTPIPIPPRSPRINLSLDREPLLELTDIQDISFEFLFKSGLLGIMKKIDDALYAVLPRIATATTNGLLKDNILVIVRAEVPYIISQEFVAHVPKMIKELYKEHMEYTHSNVHSSSNHDDNSDDNPEGDKTSKKQKSTFGSSTYASQPPIQAYDDGWSAIQDVDDGVDICDESDIEFLAEIQGEYVRKARAEYNRGRMG